MVCTVLVMWINRETTPEELAELRESLKMQMRSADAVVYDLQQPAWHGAFVDFPLSSGAPSYTETAYWRHTTLARGEHLAAESANIIIGTSSEGGLDTLRRRYWLPSQTAPTTNTGKTVTVARDGIKVVTAPFVVTPSGHTFAEVRDGDTFLVVTLRGLDQIPDQITVSQSFDYDHLIAHWDSL